MRFGDVSVTWSFKHNPFTLMLKTIYFTMGHPIEGPQYVRQLTCWLWLVVSWTAKQKYLDQAIEKWNSPEFADYRKAAKAEYEKHMKEQGQDVPRIH